MWSRVPASWFVALGTLFASSAGSARPLEHWQLRRWTIDDGLPQNTMQAMTVDRDGYLWLGTQDGLARFDGARFVTVELPCPTITALASEPDGTLAVGTDGCGGFEISHGQVRRAPGVPWTTRVHAITQHGDDTLWGTEHGLLASRGGFARWLIYGGGAPVALADREDGSIVLATTSRVGTLTDAGVVWVGSCFEAGQDISALALEGERIWLTSRDHGVCTIEGTRHRRFTADDGLPSPEVKAVSVFPDGGVWIATLAGVARFDGQRFERPDVEGAEMASASVLADPSGHVWIGGQLTGLAVLRPRQVHTYTTTEGLHDNTTWSVFQDRGGTIWVGTEGGGLHELVGDRFIDRTPATFDRDTSIGSIAQAPDGALWLGTTRGLWRRAGEQWDAFSVQDGLSSPDIRTVVFDREGQMWIGTSRGIALRGADGRFVDVTERYGLPHASYDLIVEDRARDRMWVGGLAVFGFVANDRFVAQALDGKPNVSTILVEDSGVLVGTVRGLARIDGTDVRWLRPEQGLFTGQVLQIARRKDDYWITSNRGPYRIAASELAAYFAGRTPKVTSVSYGKHDGMLSVECNVASSTSLLIASDGRVWLPTVAGVAVFELERAWAERVSPHAVIEHVDDTRGHHFEQIGGPVELPLGERDFTVELSAPELQAPAQVTFRHQLVGYDRQWIEGARRMASYTNLPPGRYELQVQARLPGGAWGLPALVTIVLPPHIYETRLFFVIAFVVAAGAIAGLVYAGMTAARRRELALRLRVRERTHELDAALERTAASEKNFRDLLAHLPVALAVARDGAVLFANDEALRIAGAQKPDELRGGPFGDMLGAADPRTRECRLERPDGSSALVELWYLDIVFEGKPAQLCMGRDVSRRKQLEAMLRTSERMASIGTLAAGVAHEINNPLTLVTANLDQIAEELDALAMPPDLREALRDAQDGAARVAAIVRDLRTFSRPAEDVEGAIDIAPIIESTILLCRNEIRHRAELVVELAPVPPVFGNANRLGQVILNVLVNAAQAIREGAATANTITVRTRLRDDTHVEIAISDTGCGISAEHMSRLFDPFFTTKPVGRGAGLGLSICHGILTRFGGALEVESEVGSGSTFRIVLRRADATPAVATQAVAAPVPRGRILIVDDEVLITQVLQRALRGEHDVETSNLPAQALAAIREGKRYDCIVTDIMMPDLSGPEFYAAIRELDPAQAERVLFISGGTFTPTSDAFIAEIQDRLLVKPISTPEFRAAVQRVLARGAS